jgi:hypothetical protein
MNDLDRAIADGSIPKAFFQTVEYAIHTAYSADTADEQTDAARLLLQRILYRINRLKLFWYDDLRHYNNERSLYLQDLQMRVEGAWYRSEIAQIDSDAHNGMDVTQALRDRVKHDLDPPDTESGQYFREYATHAAYRRLLEILSLDALVEASQLSRVLGGAPGGVQQILTRLLIEEYGGGRLARKHSSYFEAMLADNGLCTRVEHYLQQVPWETLASINLSFLNSERKRYFLRYVGGLLYTETTTPAAFKNYQAAADRLGLQGDATSYWQLHIREDERHGVMMLDEVALPLVAMYPLDAWELVVGYDQQKQISARAAARTLRAARAADQAHDDMQPSTGKDHRDPGRRAHLQLARPAATQKAAAIVSEIFV